MFRYSKKEKISVLSVSLLLLWIGLCFALDNNMILLNGEKGDVSKIEGELFLEGADELRVQFKEGRNVALQVYSVIEKGKIAEDCKCQGRATFSIQYLTGAKDTIEVTSTNIIRVNSKAVAVDMEDLLKILEEIWRGSQ
ncbi:MAG: hypothetical protein V8K32_07985 [Candidatus Electrothrix gigas]